MKISVIGAGYVGLVTGGCLAEIGHEVVCADNDATKLQVLEAGGLPIYEPGLDKVITKVRKEGRLRFSGNPADVVAGGDAIFICVGTPLLPNGDADLSAIEPTPSGRRARKGIRPEAMERARAILPQIEYTKDAYGAAQDSEALLIATEWNEFRTLDWERVHDAMSRPLILDARNLLSPCDMRTRGFEYHCFGRAD